MSENLVKRFYLWVIIISIPLIVIITIIFGSSFLNNFFANLFATLLGIVGGIPIAFYIDRKNQENKEKAREKEKRERTEKILNLIKEELEQNLNGIKAISAEVMHFYTALKDESWKAFSDGGELQWINNPQLLGLISDAYFYVNQIIFLYEKYIDDYYTNPPGNKTTTNSLFHHLEEQSKKGQESIKTVLSEINKILNFSKMQ